MKIAVIHPIFHPYVRGGAEVVAESIVSGLKKSQDVFVITLGYEDKMEEIEGVKVYRIKPKNLFNFLDINGKSIFLRLPWHILDMFNFSQAKKVKRILKKEKPDLVLTHNLKGMGYLIPSVLRKMKIKNIHTVHDMQLLDPSGLLPRHIILTWKYRFFCKQLFKSPQVVIFPSKYIQEVYGNFGFFLQSEKRVLGNPVRKVSPTIKQNKDFRFLFLGQVEEYKGILELIDAVKSLGAGLEVVGDGKALSKAENKALGADIRFWGRLSQEQLEKEIWPQADILVNPSLAEESFGMVVIEAFSHGIPVLVSDKGALPELVNGKTGWVFKKDLKEKLAWILENKEKVLKMREDCLREAEKYLLEGYLGKLLK
ncbi:MAG: glycosyltransferase [Patescibacteria group bacterium]